MTMFDERSNVIIYNKQAKSFQGGKLTKSSTAFPKTVPIVFFLFWVCTWRCLTFSKGHPSWEGYFWNTAEHQRKQATLSRGILIDNIHVYLASMSASTANRQFTSYSPLHIQNKPLFWIKQIVSKYIHYIYNLFFFFRLCDI